MVVGKPHFCPKFGARYFRKVIEKYGVTAFCRPVVKVWHASCTNILRKGRCAASGVCSSGVVTKEYKTMMTKMVLKNPDARIVATLVLAASLGVPAFAQESNQAPPPPPSNAQVQTGASANGANPSDNSTYATG